MVSPSQVRNSGIIIRPHEVPDTIKYGCRTKLLLSPAMGSALTGCQVVYHRPGETFTVHLHPISEVVIVVFKGKGEAFLGEFWYEVREGDVIYAPETVKHGTRNPATNSEDFICYYWQVPYLSEYECLPGAREQLFDNQDGYVFPYDARGKFDVHIPQTGFIGNVNSGALFTKYGAPMRFIVWPGTGSRKLSLHRAKHPPGFEFKVHIHLDSEDTILAFRGRGQGFLIDRWYDMEAGDVLYAPSQVKHGTRNPAGDIEEPFICTGAAAPPQLELYRLAGYL
jgi:quercetin dioxygenase-like cupin family protein